MYELRLKFQWNFNNSGLLAIEIDKLHPRF